MIHDGAVLSSKILASFPVRRHVARQPTPIHSDKHMTYPIPAPAAALPVADPAADFQLLDPRALRLWQIADLIAYLVLLAIVLLVGLFLVWLRRPLAWPVAAV